MCDRAIATSARLIRISIEFEPRGEYRRLGFYKKLISKRIERSDVIVRGGLLRECIGVYGGMPLSPIQEFSSRRIQYVLELLLHLEPALRFSIEVDDIDPLN